MCRIDVFKTNVRSAEESEPILLTLLDLLPNCRVNFDFDDCDKVLRVVGEGFVPEDVVKLVKGYGFDCEELL